MSEINKTYKDSLFCYIFGNEENKEWTLSLYNAINNANVTDPNEVSIETIEKIIYLNRKNDVAFIIRDELNIYEHQSTYNPNMPVREMIYTSMMFAKHIKKNNLYEYGSTQLQLPVPQLITFYNGVDDVEDRILRLSDSFPEELRDKSDIEVKVHLININCGRNQELKSKCRILDEYSIFVDKVRALSKNNDIATAVDYAIDSLPDDSQLKKFLVVHRTEAQNMLITEFDEEKYKAMLLEEGRKKGLEEGREEGKYEQKNTTIKDIEKLVADGVIARETADILINQMNQH